jgi:hypothetical protein
MPKNLILVIDSLACSGKSVLSLDRQRLQAQDPAGCRTQVDAATYLS